MGVGVPMIFPLELVGKSCYVSNKTEVVEADGGRKGEAFGKDRHFRGGKEMAREIDDGGNFGGVGVVSIVGDGMVGMGGWNG